MKFVLPVFLCFYIVLSASWAADAMPVSESSLQLNDFEKRNHALGVKYKTISMGDAKMYRVSNINLSNAQITYNTTSTNDISLKGLEFFYKYRWATESQWKTATNFLFTTSLDEPDLPTLETANYKFEMYAIYVEALVQQHFGYEFSVGKSQMEIFAAFGIGYSVLKFVENWKAVEGSSGDSVDLKSYARHFIQRYELGVDYRVSPKWSLTLTADLTNFKTDRYHTNLYSWWTGTKVTGENDTTLDKETTGNFSSTSYALGLAYNF